MTTKKYNRLLESTEELPLLGYTVSAGIASDIEISHADFRQLVTPLGFGAEHLLPPETEPRTYIRRAMTAWLKALAAEGTSNQIFDAEDPDTKRKALVREIKSRDNGVLILALVQENIDLAKVGLSYLTNLRVFYIKPPKAEPGEMQGAGTLTLTLSATGATDPKTYTPNQREAELLVTLQDYVNYYCQTYKSPELSRMAVKVIESLHAESMRKGGSVYFVPYDERDGLARLKDLLEVQLPSVTNTKETSRLLHIPIPSDDSTKQQLAGVTHEAFLAKIVAYEKNMERFLDENKKRGIKADLMMDRISKYDAVRAELDLYHRLLGVHQEEIQGRLDALEAQARSLIELRAIGVKREVKETKAPMEPEENSQDAASVSI